MRSQARLLRSEESIASNISCFHLVNVLSPPAMSGVQGLLECLWLVGKWLTYASKVLQDLANKLLFRYGV